MQHGQSFKTEVEAMNFKKFHREAWLHPIYEGGTYYNPRHISAYHVVYIVRD